ncbi:hypothetical protein [Anaeromicropila herbilytica]|uniref:Uncharacterized protein n=1 Tax=Anaeromicropila herbilytica TaxID=2785025 RepID=A0A7R7IED8_9FIRM|nr:hypothetical protein [Anaeromicropila herbilytica]BCN32542.1 hypothetical protein bsdtb5_38370 [Anaeromicropila herbilytica]
MKKGIIASVLVVIGSIGGAIGMSFLKNGKVSNEIQKVNKFKGYYQILNQWLIIKQEGKSLEEYFVNNNYQSIAIYGMGELGCRLYEELKDSSINVKYAIDNSAICAYSNLEVLSLEDKLDDVDAIVVSAAFAFEEVQKELTNKINCPIVSIEDVVLES